MTAAAGLRLFGAGHLMILGAIPCAAAVLARFARGNRNRSRPVAVVLGFFVAINEVVWYVWRLHVEGFRFPEGLPLELCDLTLWLTVFSTFTLQPTVFDFAWLAGLGGSLMAVITPDLWAPPLSYPTIYFFLSHGGIITSLLFLVWSGLARPRPGCVWRSFCLVNLYALLIGLFDAAFHTNYMYLCRKPVSTSILSYFGPWPIYLAGGELMTIVLFWILWAPFLWTIHRRAHLRERITFPAHPNSR